MKIEGNGLNQEAAAAARATSVRPADSHADKTAAPSSGAKTDRVELSPDAQLMTSAMKAAQDAPDVRSDKVARARAKLQSGELGQDLLKLADRMLDHFLAP